MKTTKLIIIGCGHSESEEHFNNNALVSSPHGNLLIDCGYTIKQALKGINYSIADIDAIYISHVHGDHVFGLERFAYECRYKYKKRIKLYFHKSIYKELWDNTLSGSLGSNSEGPSTLDDYFEVCPLESLSFHALGVDYKLFPVEHTPNKPSFGLLINNSVVYTTDTLPILSTLKSLNFHTCFHDVSLTNSNPVHANIYDLIKLYPDELKKKIYLMSYQDNYGDFKSLINDNFLGFSYQGQELII